MIMAEITALQLQKHDPNRVSLFLDGEFAFGLPAIIAYGLRIGQVVTSAEIASLQQQSTIEAVKEKALSFLSYRPRSSAEVIQNLTAKQIEPNIIEQVVAWLTQNGALDDMAFARYWVDQRETFKPRSSWALRQELRQKGVDQSVIDEAVSEIDEIASAYQAATSRVGRWRNLPKEQFCVKIGRYLQGRGFGYEVIRQVTEQLWSADAEENNIGRKAEE